MKSAFIRCRYFHIGIVAAFLNLKGVHPLLQVSVSLITYVVYVNCNTLPGNRMPRFETINIANVHSPIEESGGPSVPRTQTIEFAPPPRKSRLGSNDRSKIDHHSVMPDMSHRRPTIETMDFEDRSESSFFDCSAQILIKPWHRAWSLWTIFINRPHGNDPYVSVRSSARE